jgi:hypothetical protein
MSYAVRRLALVATLLVLLGGWRSTLPPAAAATPEVDVVLGLSVYACYYRLS